MTSMLRLAMTTVLSCCLFGADIAVWDPGTDAAESRFALKRAERTQVLAWLQEAGLPARAIDTATLTGGALTPADFPVVVTSAHLVPLSASGSAARSAQLAALLGYLDHGGVALCLGDLPGKAYFSTAIEPRGTTGWKLSPEEPRFAWDVPDLRTALGLQFVYNPTFDSLASRLRPTALLQHYWPEAPEVRVKLNQAHHVGAGGTCYALYDALRGDLQPSIPAVFIARNAGRTAILQNNPGWWSPTPTAWFTGQKPLTIALAKLALDLQAGTVALPPELQRQLPAEPAGIEPLRTRDPVAQVDPEGAVPLARWGRFDGASWELGEPALAGAPVDLTRDPARLLPRQLDPGGRISLPLPARERASWLRIRCAYTASDAGVQARLGAHLLLNELLVYVGTSGESNFTGSRLSNQAIETNRIVFVPPGPAAALELTDPGSQPVWFDAIQVEQRPTGGSPVLYGWYAAAVATQPGAVGKFTPPPGSETFGALRVDARLNHLGPPGDPHRWDRLDQLYEQYASYHAPLHLILFGTPEWLAVPSSLAEAKSRKRAHICVPDRALFKQTISEWLDRYGSRCAAFELMNEVDIKQFWIGTPEEYTTLCNDIIPLIRAKAPGKPIISAGLAAQSEELLDQMSASGMARDVDWLANHCYSAQAPVWDLPMGLFEGHCYARGLANPLFANEQGFVWTNSEWFQGPPAWTPERQAIATDIALARLTAAGHPRVLVFTAGGDSHPYSYSDETGKPRPAYQVVMDYLQLNAPGATRYDAGLTGVGEIPLRGIYAAGSVATDGTIRVVLNPCQAEPTHRTVHLLLPLPDARPRRAIAARAGQSTTVPTTRAGDATTAWEVLDLDLPERTVLTLTPLDG
jgi:hypothetical protein